MQEKIKPILERAEKDKDVLAVALFGSYAQGKEYYRDIDVCIFLNKEMSNLKMSEKKLTYLEGLNNDIDLNIFQQLPLYIRIRIIKDCKILLLKNESLLYEIAFRTIKDFGDFEKAIELDPNYPNSYMAYYNLGISFMNKYCSLK